jgi:F-type H+-transporting ATPase subunit a
MSSALLLLLPQATEGNPPAEGGSVGEHLMHHVTDAPIASIPPFHIGPFHFEPTAHWVWFVVVGALVLLIVRLAIRSYKKGGVPTGLAAAVESLVVFIRDDIAEENIGHDGRKFTPLLCSFFFFILVAALLGLVPGTKTATGNIAVTMGLAIVSFLAMQVAGIVNQGFVHHITGLVPSGVPKILVPLIFLVEVLGIFTKPFALMVRLFANMLAGHMVITTLVLLIPLMASTNKAFGIAMIPISLGLGLFIMILEILVAFIQAYIFTLLTAIFIGMYAHPSH